MYPKVEITAEMVRERADLMPYQGRKLTVIAWLWARTVKSPNPAFADVDVPLASTFMLSTKKGKGAYIQPVIEAGAYRYGQRRYPRRPRRGKEGDQAVARCQLPMRNVGRANRSGVHQGRRYGRPHRRAARELCYRLYTVCERKKRAPEALAYNGLVQSWPEISRLARMEAHLEQVEMFADGDTDGTT